MQSDLWQECDATSAGARRRFSITRDHDMVLADVHLSDIIWSLLWLFFLFIWIMILVQVLIDLFRDHTMGGVAKALWVIALVFLPFITVFVYIIARGAAWPSGA